MFQDRGTVHVVRGARGFALAVRARSSLLSQAFWAVSQHLLCDKTEEPSPCLDYLEIRFSSKRKSSIPTY